MLLEDVTDKIRNLLLFTYTDYTERFIEQYNINYLQKKMDDIYKLF